MFEIDQKNNRKALQSYARDLTVLDCFCNQGGFALNCGLGGAKKVIGIDASSEAIARASHNAEINNLSNTVSFPLYSFTTAISSCFLISFAK